jgi:hypothetical protein
LLVGLENLFLMVPFILISQGALVGQQLREQRLTWVLSFAAAVLACLRIGGLKRLIGRLNFPRSMAALAIIFVMINGTLPVVYRSLQEGKVGTHVEAGPAYVTNEVAWLLLLPALCALVLAVPGTKHRGELWPERGWLPAGMYGLWIAGTAAHLYCLGYIYDFDLRCELIAPAAWVLCWAVFMRSADAEQNRMAYNLAMVPALVVAFFAIPSAHYPTFFLLTLLNTSVFALIYFQKRNQMALHLMVFSVAALVGGIPQEIGSHVPHFTRAHSIWIATAAYGLFWGMQSHNPVSGVFGSLISAIVVGIACGDSDNAPHWGIQAGLVVLLIHSLRWQDDKHQGATAGRILACVGWVVHGFVWVHSTGSGWMTCVMSMPLLIAYTAFSIYHWSLKRRFLPVAALLLMLSGPGDSTANRLRNSSGGVSSIVASFVLFAAGTAVALYRNRHQRNGEVSERGGNP